MNNKVGFKLVSSELRIIDECFGLRLRFYFDALVYFGFCFLIPYFYGN